MSIYIALFRGINVGGKNTLPMRELIEDMQSLGCEDVRTYIQSGNAVFGYAKKDTSALDAKIAKKIEDRHGFRPQIMMLDARQLSKAIDSNPFPEGEADPKTLHLFFLSPSPPATSKVKRTAAFDAIKAPTERYQLIGKVFYLHAPDGIGRSKLAANVEKILGVPGTGRNWRTVTKLIEML